MHLMSEWATGQFPELQLHHLFTKDHDVVHFMGLS